MRFRLVNLLIAGLAVLFGATTARANILISIDKTSQRMTVTVDGSLRYLWRISTGGPGYDTPSGEYTPFRMEKDHFSREWDDAPMPNSIFFTKIGHAIHGTFETKNLGRPVSHGCVRLARANAETLFALVKEEGMNNTRVVLNGHIPSYDSAPAVARRRPLDPNSSDDEEYLNARSRQRLRDIDDDDTDALIAEYRFRRFRGYPSYPDYRGYHEPWGGYYRRDLPFSFPFLFGDGRR